MNSETLKQLLADRANKTPVALATNLRTGDQKLLYLTEQKEKNWLLEVASQVLSSDKAQTIQDPQGEKASWFINPFNPPLRLVIVGAVHIAQPLAQMAGELGYDVTIVDPREAFASQERFPNVTLVTDWPDEALQKLKLDSRTALVTLTHDPKLDDPALNVGLRSSCFYIGALGSKKTQGGRVTRLAQAGFDDDAIARIHGPVGLAIGAKSPAEIAVSILAQITERLRA